MKKLVCVLFSLILLVAGLSGCMTKINEDDIGKGNEGFVGEIGSGDLPSDFAGELSVACTNADSERAAMEAFIESFNKKYPNITVTPTYLEAGTYISRIANVARAASSLGRHDEMYDVFWLAQDYVNGLYEIDACQPLDEVIEADDEVSKEDFVDLSVEVSQVNGKMYMMPRDYNQVVMYYNKDIFEAAGVAEPYDGMPGDEFVDMLAQLRANLANSTATNEYGLKYSDMPFLIDGNVCWDSFCWPLLKNFGAQIVDEEGEVVFDSEETRECISFWKNLIDEGYACTVSTGKSAGGAQFMLQNAAILFQSRASLSNILNRVPEDEIYGVPNLGAVSVPNFSGGDYAVGGGASGYSIYPHTSNAKEAWAFVKHIVSVEGQNAYAATGNGVPVLKSLLEEDSAVWITWAEENIGPNFNHDAFVYEMDSVTSTREFFAFIPVAAQNSVVACIDEAFTNAIAQLTQSGFDQMIREAAARMSIYIAQNS